jgi:hypothetical protein
MQQPCVIKEINAECPVHGALLRRPPGHQPSFLPLSATWNIDWVRSTIEQSERRW